MEDICGRSYKLVVNMLDFHEEALIRGLGIEMGTEWRESGRYNEFEGRFVFSRFLMCLLRVFANVLCPQTSLRLQLQSMAFGSLWTLER